MDGLKNSSTSVIYSNCLPLRSIGYQNCFEKCIKEITFAGLMYKVNNFTSLVLISNLRIEFNSMNYLIEFYLSLLFLLHKVH